jgi:hypothetical protein
MKQPAVHNVRWVVLSVLNRLGYSDQKHYERLEQFAFECWYHELKLRGAPSVKVHREKLDSTGIIHYPADYIRYTKIGFCDKGKIYTLTLNNDICLKTPQVCGSTEEAERQGVRYSLVPHLYQGTLFGGYEIPALYMIGGGINTAGYYRDDENHNQLIFDQVFSGKEIVIEYQSQGEVNSQTIVPPMFVDAMRYYITWKFYEYQPGYERIAQREYQKFSEYFTEGTVQKNMFTLEEFADVIYATSEFKIV